MVVQKKKKSKKIEVISSVNTEKIINFSDKKTDGRTTSSKLVCLPNNSDGSTCLCKWLRDVIKQNYDCYKNLCGVTNNVDYLPSDLTEHLLGNWKYVFSTCSWIYQLVSHQLKRLSDWFAGTRSMTIYLGQDNIHQTDHDINPPRLSNSSLWLTVTLCALPINMSVTSLLLLSINKRT